MPRSEEGGEGRGQEPWARGLDAGAVCSSLGIWGEGGVRSLGARTERSGRRRRTQTIDGRGKLAALEGGGVLGSDVPGVRTGPRGRCQK